MEASQFDRLTKSLTDAGTRRRLLGALATVPVLGALAEVIDEAAAKPGKGKRSRRRRHDDGLAPEGRKKGKKKKKKKGGRGTTAPPSTTRPPGTGGACDELAFTECFAPWLNDWEARVGGCTEACEAGANTACEQCLETAVTPIAEPFARCFERTCQGVDTDAPPQRVSAQAVTEPRVCNPLAWSICNSAWLVAGILVNVGLTQGLGVGFLQAQLITNGGKLALSPCRRDYGCPLFHDCHVRASGTQGVCCPPCQRYDPGTQSCVPLCAGDEACNVFGQCRKTCKQCYDYLVGGRQMPCGQIRNNCGTVLTCNGCASTERCQNRRCVPQTCVPGRSKAAGDECCLPQTCEDLDKSCGEWEDGCGGVLDCGSCCVPDVCDPEFPTCNLDDGCGGKLNCCHEGQICNTTDYDWDLCCTPAVCDPVQGWGGACVYDLCGQVCLLCGGATIEGCSNGNPNAVCDLRNGWQTG